MTHRTHTIVTGIIGVCAVLLCVAVVVWGAIPYINMVRYAGAVKSSTKTANPSFVADPALYPQKDYLQPEVRTHALLVLMDIFQTHPSEESYVAIEAGAKRLEATLSYEPNIPQYYLTLGRVYTMLAGPLSVRKEYLGKAEAYYKKALSLAPGRQEIIYAYAINLINQGRVAEAHDLVQASVSQDSKVIEGYYYRALTEFALGPTQYDAALADFEIALRAPNEYDLSKVSAIYQQLFAYYYRTHALPQFSTVIARLAILDPGRASLYEQIATFITTHHVLPVITIQ